MLLKKKLTGASYINNYFVVKVSTVYLILQYSVIEA